MAADALTAAAPASSPGGAPVRRWAAGALGALVVLALALGVLAAFAEPVALPVVLLPFVGVAALAAALTRPDAGLAVLLFATAPLLQPSDGLQAIELLYLPFYALLLVTWYGRRLVSGEAIVASGVDRAALILTVVGVAGGAVLGVLHGASPTGIFGETVGFSTIALFLPVRDLVRRRRWGPVAVGAALIWFGVWLALHNTWTTYQTILGASALWEIADVRVANGDLTMYVGTVVAFASAASVRRLRLRAVLVLLGGVCTVGVFLAKSRGYWVDLALAFLLLSVLIPPRDRSRLLLGTFGVALAAAAPVVAMLGPAATLVLVGALRRLTTLESSLTADVSLINRFVESSAVKARIADNPLIGHGFGVEFGYHNLVSNVYSQGSFVHNGFFGMWFKLGLWGLVLMLTVWGVSWASGLWACRYGHGLSRIERGMGLGAGVAMLALFPTLTTSNPFLLFDTLVVVTVASALSHGLWQRSRLAS